MKITYIGHGGFIVEVNGKTLVFDPFITPNDLAKIGIAGIISPKPTATRKDIEVNTATSLGRSLKGELNLIFNFS